VSWAGRSAARFTGSGRGMGGRDFSLYFATRRARPFGPGEKGVHRTTFSAFLGAAPLGRVDDLILEGRAPGTKRPFRFLNHTPLSRGLENQKEIENKTRNNKTKTRGDHDEPQTGWAGGFWGWRFFYILGGGGYTSKQEKKKKKKKQPIFVFFFFFLFFRGQKRRENMLTL